MYYINYVYRDKTTNTKETHTIAKIHIQLALKIINEIKKNIYFTLQKSFIEFWHSLHAPSIAAKRKLSWAVFNFSISQKYFRIEYIPSRESEIFLLVTIYFI